MNELDRIYQKMMEFYRGDPNHIQHFVKVHSFAALIGRGEALDAGTQRNLEIAALVHDIGIKPALEKFGSAAGPLQETEGPPVAEEMLRGLGVDAETIQRVCYLVSKHHTYSDVDGIDYQILLEADFLVNCYEGHMSHEQAIAGRECIFKTETGKRLMTVMFDLEESTW